MVKKKMTNVLVVALVAVATMLQTTQAGKYFVGDQMGWIIPPNGAADYAEWADEHSPLYVEEDSIAAEAAAVVSKRGLGISLVSSLVFSLVGERVWSNSNAAILEADDDVDLLERVKKDRQKRLEKQQVISSAKKETGDLQELVFRLSKVGHAIDGNDLSTASSVLADKDWVKKANVALNKLSSGPEEQTEVDAFNSSLASLISSVEKNDVESSKLAFVSSATAIEKWTAVTGLVRQLKGL